MALFVPVLPAQAAVTIGSDLTAGPSLNGGICCGA
jgi:hypothetical protein